MKLDGDKLLAKLKFREETLLKYMDHAIDNKEYESVSKRWQTIENTRQIMGIIASGDFDIK